MSRPDLRTRRGWHDAAAIIGRALVQADRPGASERVAAWASDQVTDAIDALSIRALPHWREWLRIAEQAHREAWAADLRARSIEARLDPEPVLVEAAMSPWPPHIRETYLDCLRTARTVQHTTAAIYHYTTWGDIL